MTIVKENLVSVIIPTYNRSDLIKETINSVLNQTHKNFELIMVDDGSTVNTKTVIESFKDNRIKYILQKHHGLPAVARNNGLKVAIGEYIAFLDSDDIWLPNKLEKQIESLKKNPEILLVSSNGFILSVKIAWVILPLKFNKRITFKELMKRLVILNSSVLLKRSVIDSIGLLDENPKLRGIEDYDYWLRILKFKDKSILLLKDALIKYRSHESSISETSSLLYKYKSYFEICKKYSDLDQKFIENRLRNRLYRILTNQKKQQFLKKKITLIDFLNEKRIKLNDKFSFLIESFNNKYFNFRLSNRVVWVLNHLIRFLKI